MATNFPTSLDSWTDKTDSVDDVLAAHVNNLQDAMETVQAKIGIDGSAVTTAIDYLLRHRYEEIYIPASYMTPPDTNPAEAGKYEYTTNDITRDYYAFDGGATEEHVNFSYSFPTNWNRGTIKVKFHWSSATGSTAGDTVEWALRGKFCRDSDAIDSSFGTAQVISDILLADNGADHQITSATPAITIGGTGAAGCMVDFDLYRNTDGTDDMAEDAWLFGIIIQIFTNTLNTAW